MIQTQGLTHIHLMVRDLERSLRFYQGVFGMKERPGDGCCLAASMHQVSAMHTWLTLTGTLSKSSRVGCARLGRRKRRDS
jgi:predicted enzyme related to lactoylglutathione lyase